MNSFFVLLTFFYSAYSTAGIQTYSIEDISRLLMYSHKPVKEFEAKTDLSTGTECVRHGDCPFRWTCQDVEGALIDLVNSTNHAKEIPRLKHMAKIHGKECIRPIIDVLNQFTPDQITDRISELIDEIREILSELVDEIRENLGENVDLSQLGLNEVDVASLNTELTGSVTDLTLQNSSSFSFLILILRGSGGLNLDNNLILLLALTSFQQLGAGVNNNIANPLANPFFLYILLNDNTSGRTSSTNLQDFILYSLVSWWFGGNGMCFENAFSNPLILYSLLGNSGNSNNNLILVFVLSGGLDGIGGDPTRSGCNQLFQLFSLSNSDIFESNYNLLLWWLLSGGLGVIGGGDPGSLNSLLPLILMSNSSSGGTGDNNNLLSLLAFSGVLDTGLGGNQTGNISQLLPLLLLSGNGTSYSFALPLLLFSGVCGINLDYINEYVFQRLFFPINSTSLDPSFNNLLLLLLVRDLVGVCRSDLSTLLPLILLLDGNTGGSTMNNKLLALWMLYGGTLGGGTGAPGGTYTFLPFKPILESGSNNMNILLLLHFFLRSQPKT